MDDPRVWNPGDGNSDNAEVSSVGMLKPQEGPSVDPTTGVDAEEELLHKCAVCRRRFKSKNQLHRHIRDEGHQWRGAPPPDHGPRPDPKSIQLSVLHLPHLVAECKPVRCDIGSGEEPPPTDEAGEAETQMHSLEKRHPGQVTKSEEITQRDIQWKDIGSGVVARTFQKADRLHTTSKGGPCMADIQSRKIWSLSTGKIIDECDVDDVNDERLHRRLPEADDIRVELTLKGALKLFERKGPDIAEIYSQPRICQEVDGRSFGGDSLSPGWSLDLTTKDPATGQRWDLSQPSVQSRVRKLVRDTQPYCIIGSPPCTPFSPLQEISRQKRDPKIMAKELAAGKAHILFCLELYTMQLRGRRHFVHEHPERSKAWEMPEMIAFLLRPEVGSAVLHMCAFGMMSRDEIGESPVHKATRVMSSAEEVIKRVEKRCTNESCDKSQHHRHVHLVQGRARLAQVYPRSFGIAVCEGVAAQKRVESLGVRTRSVMSLEEMRTTASVEKGQECPAEALHEPDCSGMKAFDDVSGQELNPALMVAARKEEIKYFREMGVYEKVNLKECWDSTGKAPIAVRWVDINKGDSMNPNYRSRLVAKEFNTGVCPELYAATPPSECLRLMLSLVASGRREGVSLMYADVSRAYFYAKAVRPVYVKLPDEDLEPGDEHRCES